MATRRLDEASVRRGFVHLTSQRRSVQTHLASVNRQFADFKLRAEADGFARLWDELENPPVIPPRVEEPTLRARVLESFSGQWRGLPYDAPAGTVADYPASYVKHATATFERVDPATPLYRPAPAPVWPR